MPNWNELEKDLDSIIDGAAKKTDEILASRISSLIRFTDQEILELFPEPSDAIKLIELMKIVKSAEQRNTKINQIIENSEKFAGVIVTLLSKFP